jgi:hypothetical protein
MADGREPYRYLRAYGRYCGLTMNTVAARVMQAQRTQAPEDTYTFARDDGQPLTVAGLTRLAMRGSIPAASLLLKLREYAGEEVEPELAAALPVLVDDDRA